MTIPGSIWLDEESAADAIASRAAAGEITATEAANLRKFADDGYVILSIDFSAADAAEFDRQIDRLWREKPPNISFAYDSPPLRFSTADEATQRKPRYRIHDLHSRFDLALQLYLQPLLHRYSTLILGEPAVATQSLYFEFGSQQVLHRDSIVVPTPRFGHLIAAWIALEDIDPQSGALAYVPGSHKLPFYEFAPGEYMFDGRRMGAAEAQAAMKYHDEECARRGLAPELFIAKRGEVLLWHSALLHGGGPVGDDRLTRKSFVVHYSTMRNHPTREAAVAEEGGETVWTTRELVSRDGCFGFANPLDGTFAYRR
ncbi:MAG TPA: phytanoyl-CoA dioxygenase family protein [Thermoanaerobaculia bacterium]|nr:phytanoyl-CoA dioxygenase family protein [Thermoanaerobaculia bacterium]